MSYNAYVGSISARVEEADEEALIEVAELLREDESTVIRKALREGLYDLRVQVAIQRYQSGEVPVKQAAEIAGLSLGEWLEIAREQNLTSQRSPEDLEADVAAVRGL
jgi:predicted HTH domain antitoxin